MEITGLAMLAVAAVLMITTGLPTWIVLIGVAMAFAAGGIAAGALTLPIFTSLPSRLTGLLEQDLLQALPLYVLMGALLNRLPLADMLFRVGARALAPTGAGTPLAGMALGVMLAPMNGSVGASAATLARTLQPRLEACGLSREESAAQVCVASTLGVVVPPSLVLILLGDAMLRAHTEATNLTGIATRIINTQDVFRGAVAPAALLLFLCAIVAWRTSRDEATTAAMPRPARRDWITASLTALFIAGLLGGVTTGYLYAVEAAASGGVALFLFGVATRTLRFDVLKDVLRDTMAITGALFSLLLAATVFTLVLRAFESDRWMAAVLGGMRGGPYAALFAVLAILAVCAFVLDAFEMIFVVIPVVMPPLLTRVPDATWAAVLTLLILQTSFLTPPFGYAVLMVRHRSRHGIAMRALARALLPYLAVQLAVLALVLAFPSIVWRGALSAEVTAPLVTPTYADQVREATEPPASQQAEQDALERELRKSQAGGK